MQAILFDLDETLLDRSKSILDFIDTQYDRYLRGNRMVTKENYTSTFIRLDQGGYRPKNIVYPEICKKLSLSLSADELLEDYETRFHEHCQAFSYVHEALTVLHQKYKLGLITNGREHFQAKTIQAISVEEYFDEILISEREGVKKPSPEIFLRACERLGVAPASCVFIGDHPVNDIEAASHLGMKTIWKVSHDHTGTPADSKFSHFEELETTIRHLERNGKE